MANYIAKDIAKRYSVASTSTIATLDLNESQVFRVDASAPRTLVFDNAPGANRAMTVVVHVSGDSLITWPETITWDQVEPPLLGNFTRILLIWDGIEWTGGLGGVR